MPQEAAEAIALWQACELTVPWNDPQSDYDRALETPTSAVLGGFIDDALIATVMLGHDGHRGWVYYLAVAPDQQRQGYGKTLMSACENWMRARGVRKLQLMVRAANSRVIGFYERLGYKDAEVVVLGKRFTS